MPSWQLKNQVGERYPPPRDMDEIGHDRARRIVIQTRNGALLDRRQGQVSSEA
jgi:hypothetical protein